MEYTKPPLKGKAFLLFLLLLYVHYGFSANTAEPDTSQLKAAWAKARSLEDQTQALKALVNAFWNKDNTRASKFIHQLLPLAKKQGDDHLMGFTFSKKAGLYYLASNLDSAKICYALASDYFENSGDKNAAIEMSARFGLMECLRGNYAFADSVYRQLIPQAKAAKTEAALAFLYNQMGTLHHYQYLVDTTLLYYELSEKLYGQLDDTINMLRPMYNRAVLKTQLGDLEEGLAVYLEIVEIQERLNILESLSKSLTTVAYQYRSQQLYRMALKYSHRALEVQEKLGDKRGSIGSLIGIAETYGFQKDYDQSLEYLEKAQTLAEETEDYDSHLNTLTVKANILTEIGRYDDALDVLSYGQELLKKLGKSRYELAITQQLGHTHLEAGRFEEAKFYLNKALNEVTQGGNKTSLNVLHYFLAKLYLRTKEYRKAIAYAQKSFAVTFERKDWESSVTNMSIMAEAYEELGDLESSLKSYKKYNELKDSLNQFEKVRDLAVLSKDHEFDLEKQQIAAAQIQKELALKAETKRTQLIALAVGVLAVLGFVFYISARKKNQIIAAQNKELTQLNQTKDHLFAVLGHDLRKPAISFRGITEKVRYLIEKGDYKKLSKLGQVLEENAFALSKLTDNLLNWALTQKKALNYRPTTFPLHQVVEEMFELFETVTSDKGIELKADIPEDLELFADLNSFTVILRNLIDNAIKYTSKGGIIELSAQSGKEVVEVFVKDSGIGISDEKLKNLFTLQSNQSERGTAGEKGTGLGLHLVNELLKLHKGTIEVFSQPNEGSVFKLLFVKNRQALPAPLAV